MFVKNSRYYEIEQLNCQDRHGRTVRAVKLRRLAPTTGSEVIVAERDQLDVISKQQYRDPTRFWHIADANSELEANELVRIAGRAIKVPEN